MVQEFPQYLYFYGEYCDILDTIVDTGNEITITYYHNSACSVPSQHCIYHATYVDLTEQQLFTVDYWKSQMILEPYSNVTRYCNVIGVQKTMDRVISDYTIRNGSAIVFQESCENIIQIENGILLCIPKWKLRSDQLEWIQYLITKQHRSTKEC